MCVLYRSLLVVAFAPVLVVNSALAQQTPTPEVKIVKAHGKNESCDRAQVHEQLSARKGRLAHCFRQQKETADVAYVFRVEVSDGKGEFELLEANGGGKGLLGCTRGTIAGARFAKARGMCVTRIGIVFDVADSKTGKKKPAPKKPTPKKSSQPSADDTVSVVEASMAAKTSKKRCKITSGSRSRLEVERRGDGFWVGGRCAVDFRDRH